MSNKGRPIGPNDMTPLGKERKNCGVCKLGYSMMANVNRMVLQGIPYAQITRSLSDLHSEGLITSAPSYQSVRNHGNHHLAVETRIIRADMERRAEEMNMDIENGVTTMVNFRSTVDTIMRKGFNRIVSGEAEPNVKETLEAAKLSAMFEAQADGSESIVEMVAQVARFRQAVSDVVPKEFLPQILIRMAELERYDHTEAIGREIES